MELPSGDSEAPKGLWEIPPLTTKPVIRIRFQGYAAGNYSAYIRIKIAEPHYSSSSSSSDNTPSDVNDGDGNESEQIEEQVLVIPVEFEILPQYGLYAVNPLIEFGHIAVDDENVYDDDSHFKNKVFKKNLHLKHSKSQLEISDLDFKSVTYLSGLYVEDTNVLVLYPNEVEEPVQHWNKKLEIELEDKKAHTYHNVELIIRADIFKGNLHYDKNQTLFLIPTKGNHPAENVDCSRVLTLRNDFQIPMAIYNVTTQQDDTNSAAAAKLSLQMNSFETGMVLRPGLSFDLLVASSLCKQNEEDLKDLLANYKTAIYVYTNITNFEIPIVISSARIFVTTQTLTIWRSNTSVYTKELDLGSVPLHEWSNKGFIIFQNRNSIPIKWLNMDFQKTDGLYYNVMYHGVIKAADLNETNNYTVDLEKANYRLSAKLEEGDVAVYMVNLQTYTTEHSSAYLKISTKYENITVNIKYSTAMGRLEVDQEKLHFANCFPVSNN